MKGRAAQNLCIMQKGVGWGVEEEARGKKYKYNQLANKPFCFKDKKNEPHGRVRGLFCSRQQHNRPEEGEDDVEHNAPHAQGEC